MRQRKADRGHPAEGKRDTDYKNRILGVMWSRRLAYTWFNPPDCDPFPWIITTHLPPISEVLSSESGSWSRIWFHNAVWRRASPSLRIRSTDFPAEAGQQTGRGVPHPVPGSSATPWTILPALFEKTKELHSELLLSLRPLLTGMAWSIIWSTISWILISISSAAVRVDHRLVVPSITTTEPKAAAFAKKRKDYQRGKSLPWPSCLPRLIVRYMVENSPTSVGGRTTQTGWPERKLEILSGRSNSRNRKRQSGWNSGKSTRPWNPEDIKLPLTPVLGSPWPYPGIRLDVLDADFTRVLVTASVMLQRVSLEHNIYGLDIDDQSLSIKLAYPLP